MIHQLKIESQYFNKIVQGLKTYEIRQKKRDYQVGDYLGLNEIPDYPNQEGEERKETGSFVLVKIVDILDHPDYVKEGFVVLSVRPCEITETTWDNVPYYNDYSPERVQRDIYRKLDKYECG